MPSYIIQVSLCWLGFYAIYYLFLSRETFFTVNRWYLLTTVLLGVIIPAIDWQALYYIPDNQFTATLQPIVIGTGQTEIVVTPESEKRGWNWGMLLYGIYTITAVLLLIRITIGMLRIYRLIKEGEKKLTQNLTWVFHTKINAPFSFFRYLFCPDTALYQKDELAKIEEHELAHVKGRHTIDVIILECLSILFWFNPLIYLYKRSLRLTHEYIADRAVLRNSTKKQYGHLLLRQSQSGPAVYLAHYFNYSPLKKRFNMMKRTNSKPLAFVKYLMVIPMLAVLALLFGANKGSMDILPAVSNEEAQATQDSIPFVTNVTVDQLPVFKGCDDLTGNERINCGYKRMLEFIYKRILYPKPAREREAEEEVIAQFTVDRNGNVSSANILQCEHPELGKAVLAVLKEMPQWQPGMQNGKPVDVEFTLPVRYKIENGNEASKAKEESTSKASNYLNLLPRILVVGYGPAKAADLKTVEQRPIFKGCEGLTGKELEICSQKELLMFVYQNLKYPSVARDSGIAGTVVARFTIDKDGKVQSPKILKPLGGGTDEEVLRVIEQMPQWKPAQQDGKAVAFEYTLPVKFKIDDAPASEDPGEAKDNKAELNDDETIRNTLVFRRVDEMARFPGCEDEADPESCAQQKLIQFIYDHLYYPTEAKEAKVEGVVIWSFVVEKNGAISDFKLMKGIGHGCDEAVKNVLELMPKWIPGQYEGEAARVQINLPVRFKLPETPAANTMPGKLQLSNYQLAPNPNQGSFNLQFSIDKGPLQIQITDLSGKVVFNLDRDDFSGYFNEAINISNQPAGSYFLRIKQGDQMISKKIIMN